MALVYTYHNTRLYVAQYIAKYGSTAVPVYIPSAYYNHSCGSVSVLWPPSSVMMC